MSVSVVFGCLTAALVIWSATLRRQHRLRLESLERRRAETAIRPVTKLADGLWGVVGKLPVVRRYYLDAGQRRHLLMSLVAVLASLAVSKPLGIGVAVGAAAQPWWHKRSLVQRRQRDVQRELPLAVDLFRVAVNSGLNVTMATEVVAEHLIGPLGEALKRSLIEVAKGRRIADALEAVVTSTSEDVRPLIGALVSSERYGSSLSTVLERVAHESRIDQERRADSAAKKLSLQLLFPLAGCTLPAFALLTVAPLLAGSFGSLADAFH